MSKRALIFGVGGQDGSYLAELLLGKGYEVHGTHRRSSVDNLVRVRHVLDGITLHKCDLLDIESTERAIVGSNPAEVYNLADQDNVDWSYATPTYSRLVTDEGARNVMNRVLFHRRTARVFQPLSATMFGPAPPPQNESTPPDPQSPYAKAKARAWESAKWYRAAYGGFFVSTAILFNHDSPRRGGEYLLHSICRQAVEVAAGKRDSVAVGDPDQKVDIGHAKDYVKAVWMILQHDEPDDFVVGTGIGWTVREMVECALECAGVPRPNSEEGYGELTTRDETFKRPETPPTLIADPRKIFDTLGWHSGHVLRGLVSELVTAYQSEPRGGEL